MFKQKFCLTLFMGLVVFSSASMFAQEEPKDQLFWVREEVARVDLWQQYEETSKEWVELMTGAGLDFPYMRASQRDDAHYYYLLPLESYSDIDKFPEIFGSAVKKIGKEKWSKFIQRNESSMVTHRDIIVKWLANYSYVAKEPAVKMEEAGFIHWVFFKYKLEKKQALLDVVAEWKALYEKHNIPNSWSTWSIEVGEQNNTLIFTEAAKDGESFYANMKANSEKLKGEDMKLWEKFATNVLSMEIHNGQPRPDLGFVKEQK